LNGHDVSNKSSLVGVLPATVASAVITANRNGFLINNEALKWIKKVSEEEAIEIMSLFSTLQLSNHHLIWV
ncbi:hypothetical protein PFISCL1PPCAC_1696, partial [Pristionchus fissidentatus]